MKLNLFNNSNAQLLDFVIVGTQKGGTSALDHYLKVHPNIGMGKGKELHFFDKEKRFSRSKINYEALHKKIIRDKDTKITGETTPIYMYWEPCIRRIWEYNPQIKIIAVLRNPMDRAFSHWNMERSRNWEKEDFYECIVNEGARVKESRPFQHRVYSYTDRGFYSEQIRRILRYFDPEQVFFIKYELFLQQQQQTLQSVFEFLGVDASSYLFKEKVVHQKAYLRAMTEREKQYLHKLYHYEVCEVERLLNWDCSDWKK